MSEEFNKNNYTIVDFALLCFYSSLQYGQMLDFKNYFLGEGIFEV